jgi:hypothetical protein
MEPAPAGNGWLVVLLVRGRRIGVWERSGVVIVSIVNFHGVRGKFNGTG